MYICSRKEQILLLCHACSSALTCHSTTTPITHLNHLHKRTPKTKALFDLALQLKSISMSLQIAELIGIGEGYLYLMVAMLVQDESHEMCSAFRKTIDKNKKIKKTIYLAGLYYLISLKII